MNAFSRSWIGVGLLLLSGLIFSVANAVYNTFYNTFMFMQTVSL
jgi:hypothetical protein